MQRVVVWQDHGCSGRGRRTKAIVCMRQQQSPLAKLGLRASSKQHSSCLSCHLNVLEYQHSPQTPRQTWGTGLLTPIAQSRRETCSITSGLDTEMATLDSFSLMPCGGTASAFVPVRVPGLGECGRPWDPRARSLCRREPCCRCLLLSASAACEQPAPQYKEPRWLSLIGNTVAVGLFVGVCCVPAQTRTRTDGLAVLPPTSGASLRGSLHSAAATQHAPAH